MADFLTIAAIAVMTGAWMWHHEAHVAAWAELDDLGDKA